MKCHTIKRILLASALSLLPAAVFAQSPNPQAVSMYNLGLTAYKQGSPESAIIFFKRATDIDPNLADAQYNLGVIYQTQKRYKDALPRFLEVLRIKPSDPDAHFQLGLIYQELGQPAEARQHYSAIAPNNPHFPDAQNHVAQINSQGGGMMQQSMPQTGTNVGQPYQSAAAPPDTNPYQAQPANQLQQGVNTLAAGQYGQPIGAQGQTGYGGDQTALAQPQATGYTQQTQPAQSYPQTSQGAAQGYGQVGQSPPQTYTQPAPSTPAAQPAAPPAQAPVPVLANASLRVVATGFNAPAGLAFDRTGNLYVANFLSNTIDRISADGSRTQFSSGANLKGPIGLTTDESGNLYVANYNGGSVARISPAGVATIVATGFRKPYYLTLDRDGNLYVSQQEDNSIVRITLPRPIGARPQ
jgi:Tfp pilus assembly protein PilF